MNGRHLIAGLAALTAVGTTLVITTQPLNAQALEPLSSGQPDRVAQLEKRIAALEAEVKSLRQELRSRPTAPRELDFRALPPRVSGESKVRVNINGKEYELPRDKEKLRKDFPDMKLGEGLPRVFSFGPDSEGMFKFEAGKDELRVTVPKEIQEQMRKAMEEMRRNMRERRERQPSGEIAPSAVSI